MKVLVAAGRPPWPPWRGDQLRARQLVEALAAEHEVTLLAPAAAGEPPPPPGVQRTTFETRGAAQAALLAAPGLLRGWPFQALPFRQPDLARQLRLLAPRHDLVVLQLVRLVPHLPDVAGAPLVTDLVDCLSLNAETRAAVDHALFRPLLGIEARRVRAAESRMAAAARAALVVSERDRRALVASLPARVAGRVVVAPVAIQPPAATGADTSRSGATVMLTGNLGYFPNRDALRFFLDAVWPGLRAAVPGAELRVAGDRPPAALAKRLALAGGTLIARPPELRGLLASAATVAVAPLRCGSGVPLKILDAWAAGVPVVASPFAAAGVAAEPERDLVVAETPVEWVAQVRRVLDDPRLRRELAEAGRARLAELAPERVYPLLRRFVTGGA